MKCSISKEKLEELIPQWPEGDREWLKREIYEELLDCLVPLEEKPEETKMCNNCVGKGTYIGTFATHVCPVCNGAGKEEIIRPPQWGLDAMQKAAIAESKLSIATMALSEIDDRFVKINDFRDALDEIQTLKTIARTALSKIKEEKGCICKSATWGVCVEHGEVKPIENDGVKPEECKHEYIEQLQQQITHLKAEVIEADHEGYVRGQQDQIKTDAEIARSKKTKINKKMISVQRWNKLCEDFAIAIENQSHEPK